MRLTAGTGWALGGFDLSGVDAAGVDWLVTSDTEGVDDMPGTRGGVVDQEHADGGRVEPTYLESLSIVLRVRISAPTPESADAALEQLKAAVPVRDLAPLVHTERGRSRHRLVKQEGKPTFKRVSEYIIDASIQLAAPNPRALDGDGTGPTFTAGPVALPKVTGGLRIKPPGIRLKPGGIRIKATVNSGQILLDTEGTETPPTLLRIVGPLPDFTITATLGDSIQVQRYIEPVPAGQFLDIDLDRRLVRINGTVSRRNKLVGPWIIPAPGMVFKFDSSTHNDTASMQLFASSAWR